MAEEVELLVRPPGSNALVSFSEARSGLIARGRQDAAMLAVPDNGDPLLVMRRIGDQGQAEAQFKLGLAYSNGDGVPKDDVEAVRWFREAAVQGHPEAQLHLGYAHYDGKGTPHDEAEAMSWYLKAAKQGLAEARVVLGERFYLDSEGAEWDIRAHFWLQLASEQGYAPAQYRLAELYENRCGKDENHQCEYCVKAAHWYRKGAEQGDSLCLSGLGWCYEQGLGVPKDDREASHWYGKAQEHRNH